MLLSKFMELTAEIEEDMYGKIGSKSIPTHTKVMWWRGYINGLYDYVHLTGKQLDALNEYLDTF